MEFSLQICLGKWEGFLRTVMCISVGANPSAWQGGGPGASRTPWCNRGACLAVPWEEPERRLCPSRRRHRSLTRCVTRSPNQMSLGLGPVAWGRGLGPDARHGLGPDKHRLLCMRAARCAGHGLGPDARHLLGPDAEWTPSRWRTEGKGAFGVCAGAASCQHFLRVPHLPPRKIIICLCVRVDVYVCVRACVCVCQKPS